MEDLVTKLTGSDGIDSTKIKEMAKETEQKATKIMKTYLGEDPDSQHIAMLHFARTCIIYKATGLFE